MILTLGCVKYIPSLGSSSKVPPREAQKGAQTLYPTPSAHKAGPSLRCYSLCRGPSPQEESGICQVFNIAEASRDGKENISASVIYLHQSGHEIWIGELFWEVHPCSVANAANSILCLASRTAAAKPTPDRTVVFFSFCISLFCFSHNHVFLIIIYDLSRIQIPLVIEWSRVEITTTELPFATHISMYGVYQASSTIVLCVCLLLHLYIWSSVECLHKNEFLLQMSIWS